MNKPIGSVKFESEVLRIPSLHIAKSLPATHDGRANLKLIAKNQQTINYI